MNSDRVLGVLAVLMGAGMAVLAWGYKAQVEYEPVGPRAFPLLLAALIALCGLWLTFKPAHRAHFGSGFQMRSVALCALFVVLYAVLFQVLGFVLATALMSIPVGRIFGGSWKQSVLTGIGMGVVLFVLFDTLLDVVLPAGVLKPLFTAIGL
jgi:putative tricarboxylic transport membrane protein